MGGATKRAIGKQQVSNKMKQGGLRDAALFVLSCCAALFLVMTVRVEFFSKDQLRV